MMRLCSATLSSMIEKERTETLVSVNLGGTVEHSALFPVLSSYSMVDSKEHALCGLTPSK